MGVGLGWEHGGGAGVGAWGVGTWGVGWGGSMGGGGGGGGGGEWRVGLGWVHEGAWMEWGRTGGCMHEGIY